MRNPRKIFQAIYDRLTIKANRGPIGVGLIGVGGWGYSSAMNIMRSKRFNIVGVHDLHEEPAHRFANRFNTHCFNRVDELLAAPDIQAVCVAVPNHFHAKLVKTVADAKKHIFIEKPLASLPDVCSELGQYCQDKQVILQVGHQMRRDPAFREIKRILDNRELGRTLFVQGVSTLDRQNRNDWRKDPDSCPCGSMEQLGAHLIDVLLYLFGSPRKSHGWAKNIPFRSDTPDWGFVSLLFDHDIRAAVSTSFSSPAHMRMEFFCERGHLATDGQRLWINSVDSTAMTCKPKGMPGGVAQFVEFANCIEHGQAPETGAAQARVVIDAVCSIKTE